MAQSDVNGENANAIFKWLYSEKPFAGFGEGDTAKFMDQMLSRQDPDYASNPDINGTSPSSSLTARAALSRVSSRLWHPMNWRQRSMPSYKPHWSPDADYSSCPFFIRRMDTVGFIKPADSHRPS